MKMSDLAATIRRIEIRSKRVVNTALAGRYHSVFKGQGVNFAEVREYAPGDDVRQIDWNVTARAKSPHIKLFHEERELSVVIAADISASGEFGTQAQLRREVVAEIAAILGLAAAQNNDRVGAVLFSDQVESFIPVRKGRGHVLRLIRDLLAVTPARPGTSIEAGLRFVLNVQRRSGIVFLISDFIDSGYERMLQLAAMQHDVVPIVLRDPLEQVLPDVGLVKMIDPETGQYVVLDSGRSDVRAAYAARAEARDQRLIRFCRQLNISPILIRLGDSYVDPLVRYFNARGNR